LIDRSFNDAKQSGGNESQEDKTENGDVPVLGNLSKSTKYVGYLAYSFIANNARQSFEKFSPYHPGFKNQFKNLYQYYQNGGQCKCGKEGRGSSHTQGIVL
jgi:hypothetical protein